MALGRITPNPDLIASTLRAGGVDALDAVLTAHSHHDHALDSAEVIHQRGGHLYGSQSTLMIGRGAGLPERQLHLISDGTRLSFGTIDVPLSTPARASAFKDGGGFSLLVTHPTGSVFLHPSANTVPGKFAGHRAQVLNLGIGALGAQTPQFQREYWRQTVGTLTPRLVVPVHWDDFGRPLTRRLRPLPRFMDKLSTTKAFVDSMLDDGEPRVHWQQAMETITPFER